MRPAGLACAIIGIVMSSGIAAAGDYADIEILGFSPDGKTFAFEEYGTQDGSGFAYSNIYVVSTADDQWVAGTPIRVQADDEQIPLTQTRAQARSKAQPILQARAVGTSGNHVASNPPTEVSADPHHVIFLPRIINPLGGTAYDLSLTEIEFPAGDCPDMGQPFHGFRLSLTTASGGAQTLAADSKIPTSRHCPLNYAISDVLTFYPDGGVPVLAVVLSMYTVGFEGPDRRFLAVTSALPE
jgi:predicted secreted protein